MSYDVELTIEVNTGGPEPVTFTVEDIGNYTSNVSPMWVKALGGRRLSDLADRPAGDQREDLRRAVADMEANPDTYRAMNPENGWGDYEGALAYLTRLRDACCAHPNAVVRVDH